MAFFPGQPGSAGTKKVNHSGFSWNRRWWGGSGISWTICKSFSPQCRQITTSVPHHLVFKSQMPFLPPNQPRQITVGNTIVNTMANRQPVQIMTNVHWTSNPRCPCK